MGNFYLAGKGGGKSQVLLGVGNFLLWPISPAWAVYQGYSDAKILNSRALAEFVAKSPNVELRENTPPASKIETVATASASQAVAQSELIDGWEYDSATYRGYVRLKMDGGKNVEAVRAMARNLIAKIVSDKNITIVAGESLPEGATFKMLGEKLEDGILQIEFEAN